MQKTFAEQNFTEFIYFYFFKYRAECTLLLRNSSIYSVTQSPVDIIDY